MAKKYIEIVNIKIDREARQRREIGDTSDLEASLKKIGLLNPILVDEEFNLIAGERRLTAAKNLGWEKIEFRLKSELTPHEKKLVELDENLRRKDLHWKDEALSFLQLHEMLGGTFEQTASDTGHDVAWVNRAVNVGRALRSGEKRIESADGLISASNILSRLSERAMSSELSNIHALVANPQAKEETAKTVVSIKVDCPIVNLDFLKFAEAYDGKPFNLIHCDFPYGINHDKSDQGGADQWGGYKDDPDTYWKLCHCLVGYRDKLILPSAHIFFWFSMKFYSETVEFFENAGFKVNKFPLVWHKTDSKGILPDPNRGPRQVYETALLITSGDRKIVRAVDNTYGSPTSKALHLSEKPEPMLKHFFRMLVDEYSEVLDPTCGSGNAILAAARLGAKRVVGLEINPEFCAVAQTNFKKERQKDLLAQSITV